MIWILYSFIAANSIMFWNAYRRRKLELNQLFFMYSALLPLLILVDTTFIEKISKYLGFIETSNFIFGISIMVMILWIYHLEIRQMEFQNKLQNITKEIAKKEINNAKKE